MADLMFPSGGSSKKSTYGDCVYISMAGDNNGSENRQYGTAWIDYTLIEQGTGVIQKSGTVTVITACYSRQAITSGTFLTVKLNDVAQTMTYNSGGMYNKYSFAVEKGDVLALSYSNGEYSDEWLYAAVFLAY